MKPTLKQVVLVLLIFGAQYSYCQKKLSPFEQKLKEKFWSQDFDGFKETEVPEKWKNESAVILSKSYEYEIEKEVFLLFLYENEYFHTRVKLLDEAAVEKYSKFSFNKRYGNNGYFATKESGKTFAGFKVIKPDGTEIEIDVTTAVENKTRAPEITSESKRIAITNLEKGDILDYYFLKKKTTLISKMETTTIPPNYIILADEEPILKSKVTLRPLRKCYITAKSVNGAPELKLGVDKKNKSDIYYLMIENQEKINLDKKRWFQPFLQLPMIKFEGYNPFKKGYKSYQNYYIKREQKEKLNNSISKNEILMIVNSVTDWPSDFSIAMSKLGENRTPSNPYDLISDHIKKTSKTNLSTDKLIEKAYYFFRQLEYREGYESENLYNTKKQFGINNTYFVRYMSRFLEKNKIDHDILVTHPKTLTKFDDIALSNELLMLIKINGATPYYLCNFNRYSIFKDISPEIQGNDAYQVNWTKDIKSRTISKVKIPSSTAKESVNNTTLKVRFNSKNIEELNIDQNVKLTGALKMQNQYNIVTPYEYIYGSKNDQYETELLINTTPKRKKDELNQRIKEKQKEENEERTKKLEESLKNEFDLKEDVKITNLEILSLGMWIEKPTFEYTTQFEINEFVKKVGSNYLLDVGKLIGSQVDVEEDISEEPYDMYQPFARTYENKIEIDIPQGYTLKGYDKLNFNVSNDYASFISTAKINSNVLTIKTSKIYKSNFTKAENTQFVIQVLKAANNFYKQKILLSN